MNAVSATVAQASFKVDTLGTDLLVGLKSQLSAFSPSVHLLQGLDFPFSSDCSQLIVSQIHVIFS